MRVAVDSGGTFTDAVGLHEGKVWSAKVPSTPHDPSRAVLQAIAELTHQAGVDQAELLIHGTTVATNALLEGRGAETWWVTNEGFGGLLAVGRQSRPRLYALQPSPRQTLVPPERVVEVRGRLGASGERIQALDFSALEALVEGLDDAPRAWAVLFLHAYAHPEDEQAVAHWLRQARPMDTVCASHEVLPVFREVERGATTVANAFVQPVMASYLGKLQAAARRVMVMGSHGGTLHLDHARALPVQTALSGPAGGVVAAAAARERMGVAGVLSFDMGGTSTDVALCQGELPLRRGGQVGEHTLHVPMLDIHTVGAGGGSIAWCDDAGVLRVGPRSAGADPGPAAYGKGTLPTVTDAHVVLGRLPSETRLGGRLVLDVGRAERAVEGLGKRLQATVEETALAIVAIANAHMARAMRRISVERGVDPRPLWLIAFGGAGGLHAAELVEFLGMRGAVMVPRAGLLSAVGMLLGAQRVTKEQTVLGAMQAERSRIAQRLAEAAASEIDTLAGVRVEAACRFEGQGFELDIPWNTDPEAINAAFRLAHEERFGHVLDRDVEVVTLRAVAEGNVPKDGQPLWDFDAPMPGDVRGPKSVVTPDATWWVPPGWALREHEAGLRVLVKEVA